MNQEQYQLAKIIIKHELEQLLQLPIDDEITVSKYLYMFWTGLEATTNDGKIHNVYPVGPFLKWLIENMIKKIQEEENPIKKIRFTGKYTKHLLEQVEYEPIAWEAAKNLAYIINQQGDELSKELHEFFFRTAICNGPPKKRGPSKMKKFHRDTCIIMLITELKRVGILYATKSSSYSETHCICDAIVEVLHDLRIPLDYDGVKLIYDNRNELQKSISSFRLDISEKGRVIIGYSF
jgi:hypothetical protein